MARGAAEETPVDPRKAKPENLGKVKGTATSANSSIQEEVEQTVSETAVAPVHLMMFVKESRLAASACPAIEALAEAVAEPNCSSEVRLKELREENPRGAWNSNPWWTWNSGDSAYTRIQEILRGRTEKVAEEMKTGAVSQSQRN